MEGLSKEEPGAEKSTSDRIFTIGGLGVDKHHRNDTNLFRFRHSTQKAFFISTFYR